METYIHGKQGIFHKNRDVKEHVTRGWYKMKLWMYENHIWELQGEEL